MIVPRLANETLLADIAVAQSSHDTLHLWWLG